MEVNNISSDYIIAELIDMGFEFSKVREAIQAVGPCLDDAIEFILKGSCDSNEAAHNSTYEQIPTAHNCSTSQTSPAMSRIMSSKIQNRTKQSSITDHLQSLCKTKKGAGKASTSALRNSEPACPERQKTSSVHTVNTSESFEQYQHAHACPARLDVSLQQKGNFKSQNFPVLSRLENQEFELDWEQKVGFILQKHFGFSSLKGFQKEAMETWLAHRDCLVLAATGSGKSLCFQIPALLTGKVVVVISPLISLMHDQCFKLAKHGVPACFLGSGQPDSGVENRAMEGMYDIIYVCPETLLRLVEPLQRLAENRGIALFAIDEVHCVSKWGHDFRPDYRRLSALRENFKAANLKSLKFDIPLMALTATATIAVRKDIVKSLHMSEDTKIILTSFFRPNLRFSVRHSKTSSMLSYEKDFQELIESYAKSRMTNNKHSDVKPSPIDDDSNSSYRYVDGCTYDANEISLSESEKSDNDCCDGNDAEVNSRNESNPVSFEEEQMTAEYLEEELDAHHTVNDFDVSCGEFSGHSPAESLRFCGPSETPDQPTKLGKRLEHGPTIIYVPTRKETVQIAKYLCRFGVRAAAYNAKLPKTHLRRVHEEFHHNVLEVVVATIAFGMGIDKSNVRKIIHYGWPQSLEAYYQEAGRAGRDGKLSDCILYANLARIPTLLPSKRSNEQTKQAYKMLSDCFRYGMNTTYCRARTLVKYFGEDFSYGKCHLCDICVDGLPRLQNLEEEATVLLQVLVAKCGHSTYGMSSQIASDIGAENGQSRERPNLRMVISTIRAQFQKFSASDQLWWQGLTRILEEKGYIREGDGMVRVAIKFPELTDLGFKFLHSESERILQAYPEADMLLSMQTHKPYSTFSEWGRGWADPEIRRQRLQRTRNKTRKRKRNSRRSQPDPSTVRGRITSKLVKQKHNLKS